MKFLNFLFHPKINLTIRLVSTVFSSLIFLLLFHPISWAISDPLAVPNNKFGIHIADPVDLADAATLVNSSGGDYGYITFVIRSDERDTKRWQKVFDQCRNLHLIPIVRLASRLDGPNWLKLNPDEIDGWVSFFNSLNWVTQNRYVIIGNEPNHTKEWGGEINPSEYAQYLKTFSEKVKQTNDDYFILPAGLDASAPNSKTTMEESLYIRKMLEFDANIFDYIDGWTSHSYPNPAFSGSEFASGKGTIKTYEWELNYLKKLGVKKELLVFITETGWAHNGTGNKKYTSIDKIADKFKYAFNNVWNDERIVAVTPFILGYGEPPFDVFSWKDKTGKFYDFYNKIQDLLKVKGDPIQVNKGRILAILTQPFLIYSFTFQGLVLAENTGQSIWNKNNVTLKDISNLGIIITETSLSQIEPNNIGIITFKAQVMSKSPLIIIISSLMNLNLIFGTISGS